MDFCTKTGHNVDKKGDKHPRVKRFERDLLRLSAQERRAIDALMRQTAGLRKKTDRAAMTKKVAYMANACARTNARRTSDRNTDHDRRTLVGARIKREQAERYKRIAQATGRSLYRFVADALEAEAGKAQDIPPSGAQTQDVVWQPLVGTIYPLSPGKTNPPGPPGGGQGAPPGPVSRALSGHKCPRPGIIGPPGATPPPAGSGRRK